MLTVCIHFLAVFIFVQSLSSAPAPMQLTKLAASLSAPSLCFFFLSLGRFAQLHSVNSPDPVHEQKEMLIIFRPNCLAARPFSCFRDFNAFKLRK